MNQYLVLVSIDNKDLKWYVYAKNGREAITKTLSEINSEFDHWDDVEVRCKLATIVRDPTE